MPPNSTISGCEHPCNWSLHKQAWQQAYCTEICMKRYPWKFLRCIAIIHSCIGLILPIQKLTCVVDGRELRRIWHQTRNPRKFAVCFELTGVLWAELSVGSVIRAGPLRIGPGQPKCQTRPYLGPQKPSWTWTNPVWRKTLQFDVKFDSTQRNHELKTQTAQIVLICQDSGPSFRTELNRNLYSPWTLIQELIAIGCWSSSSEIRSHLALVRTSSHYSCFAL